MQDDIFQCIPSNEGFIRKSERIAQRKQKKYDIYSPLFVQWATYIPYEEVRKIINQTFQKCKPYLDKIFFELFPIKDEFGGRFWELTLCNFLLSKNITLDDKKKEKGTPDFCAIYENKKIWIEATNPAEHDSVKDLGNGVHQLDEISLPRYLRLSNSFIEKSKKWNKTYQNGCNENEAFIIAINGSDIDSWSTDKGMLGILYGIGLTQFDKHGNMSYQNLSHLKKKDVEPFEVGYFLKPEFSHVSGVIYMESSFHFENNDILVSLQYIPNINARNPIPKEFIEKLNLHIPITFG